MKLQEFACPNCHAPLIPIEGARYMFCDYCGTRIVIDDIEYYREDSKTERKRMQIDADVRNTKLIWKQNLWPRKASGNIAFNSYDNNDSCFSYFWNFCYTLNLHHPHDSFSYYNYTIHPLREILAGFLSPKIHPA